MTTAAQDRLPPTVAWKFTTPEFMARFFNFGLVRFSCAHEIRSLEETEAGRGDAHEMAHSVHHKSSYVIPDSADPDSADDLKALSRIGPFKGTLPTFNDVGFIFNGPPHYRLEFSGLLFCMSAAFTPEVVARMASEFGYEACFRISDTTRFAKVMVEHVGPAWAKLGRVDYEDREIDVLDDDYNVVKPFRKAAKFGWQDEVRVVVSEPSRRSAKIIVDPRLIEGCAPVDSSLLDQMRRIYAGGK